MSGPQTWRPLAHFTGIGPARTRLLAAAGLEHAGQLLWRLPRIVGMAPPIHQGGPLPDGPQPIQLLAEVTKVQAGRRWGRRMIPARAEARLADGTGLSARWFNAPWIHKSLVVGGWYRFAGTLASRSSATLDHPRFQLCSDQAQPPWEEGPELRWPVPAGFAETGYQKLLDLALTEDLPGAVDPLAALSPAIWQATLRQGHRPQSADEHEAARRLLAEREILALRASAQRRRSERRQRQARACPEAVAIAPQALAAWPFSATAGQRQAVLDIARELAKPRPMRRLLHGEVGSGKTAVCTAAAQLMAETGGITLWLVPTTTLVRQHGRSVGTWWPRHLAPWGHVTGSSSSGERKRIAEELRDGRLSGCIGTQALFDDMFKSLPIGLVMVDEEQRFGVAQRQQLLQPHAGIEPHYLGCSATPIPRSLALVSHGGTELSRLDERPPGRQAVTTAIQGWRMGSVESAIAKCLEHQGAVFVIVPRKQAGLKRSAVELGKHLAQRFGSERVQSCTGDDPEAVQHERIEALQAGSIDVLVATTVIEVGIDVPRAELMIVCDAEFFGLAQLHQLRGRLGRGHRPGHCLLLSASTAGRARIQALADLDNGFAVAAEDLRQRGSGSLDGEAQHGHGALFCLDPVQDEDLLEAAPAAADTAYPDAESWFSSVNPTDDPGDGSG